MYNNWDGPQGNKADEKKTVLKYGILYDSII